MKDNTFPYAFFEGKVVDTEEAKLPLMTNAVQYGTAVIGGMRGYYNRDKEQLSIFRMGDHYKRFLNSLKILGVTINYDLRELKLLTTQLAEQNTPNTDVYFRPYAYAPSYNLSPNLNADSHFEFALYMIPLNEYLPVNKGLSVMVSTWRRIPDNSMPSRGKFAGGYLNSALARGEAEARGFNEAICLTENGSVAEGSAENLFLVREGTLVTSPGSEDILEGITRNTVMQFARDLNIPVEERTIDRSELYVCDEAFFSGTGVQVAWISKVDNRKVGAGEVGPITKKIQKLYFEAVRGERKEYKHWCVFLTKQGVLA